MLRESDIARSPAVADLVLVRPIIDAHTNVKTSINCRLWKSIPVGAIALLATSISAFAEPGVRPARASDFIYCGAAVVIIVAGLFGLGALSTWLLHRFTNKRGSFIRTTLLFAAAWGFIGVITGVIPMIFLAVLFGSAGRTM